MKTKTDKSDNQLIAEFMGLQYGACNQFYFHENSSGTKFIGLKQPKELPYPTSWDWLLPVVEKINQLYEQEPDWMDEYEAVVSKTVSNPIEVVYKAVIGFIKWYNSQKS